MCKSIIVHIYFNRNQIDNPQKLVMFPEHSSGKGGFFPEFQAKTRHPILGWVGFRTPKQSPSNGLKFFPKQCGNTWGSYGNSKSRGG